MNRIRLGVRVCAGWMVVWCGAHSARGVDAALGGVVPADALGVLFLDVGDHSSQPLGMVDVAAGFVGQARGMGLLSGLGVRNSAALDVLAAIPVLTRQPIAFLLTDIRAKAIPGGGHKLAGLRASLLMRTRGENTEITRLIQQFLNRYTNSDVTRIASEARGGSTRYRLTDERWPAWAVVEWGRVGDYYVVGLGDGAFDASVASIERTGAPMDSDIWFQEAADELDLQSATASWYLNFDSLKCALAPGLGGLEEELAGAVVFPGVERSMWVVGFRDRGLRFEYYQDTGDRSRRYRVATPASRADLDSGMIPDGADWYALVAWEPTIVVPGYASAYTRSRGPGNRARLRAYWAELQSSLGISIERDLLFQLGSKVLAHNDPPHPLGAGWVSTVQFEIAGSSSTVRSTVDKLMSRWRDEWAAATGGHAQLLHRGADGVWYLQYGLIGPAIGVHDGWVVVGSSPHAVRHNFARLSHSSHAQAIESPSP